MINVTNSEIGYHGYNSGAANNYVHEGNECIVSSQSHLNRVYNNTISRCHDGIKVWQNSSRNKIYNNTILNSADNGIIIQSGASYNKFYF
jgi:parallel beta-helix repeat protein